MFPHKSARAGGFTLVEILVVVIILGIASAIILPQVGTRNDLVAAAAARVVMSDLIYAQNRSIASQKKHYLQFVGQQYSVMTRPDDTSTTFTANQHPVTKNSYSATFGVKNSGLDSVTLIDANPTFLGFDELGSPFSYDPVTNLETTLTTEATITIRAGTMDMTIRLEPYTGECSVQ
jgi:prepilin-type N-terminal cleavage/methylation domain-containing protein